MTYGVVQVEEIGNKHSVSRLAKSSSALELLDESGSASGIRVYGNKVAKKFEDMNDGCHLEGRFRNASFWHPRSVDEVSALVTELGYLIVGTGLDNNILLLANTDDAIKAWKQGLAKRHEAIMKEAESARRLVTRADCELDIPF